MISYKGYYIKPNTLHPGTYSIVTEGKGGRIPDKMLGIFTSTGVAINLIDRYVDNRPPIKGKNNASEATATSGD